jgi:hypothetical protein
MFTSSVDVNTGFGPAPLGGPPAVGNVSASTWLGVGGGRPIGRRQRHSGGWTKQSCHLIPPWHERASTRMRLGGIRCRGFWCRKSAEASSLRRQQTAWAPFFFWRGQPGAAPTGGGGDSSGGELDQRRCGLGMGRRRLACLSSLLPHRCCLLRGFSRDGPIVWNFLKHHVCSVLGAGAHNFCRV